MQRHGRDPVVIVGGGFGGLAAARALHRMQGDIILGFRNRARVMFEWIWYYVTFKPGARLIYWKDRRMKEP